eukprot:1722481-Rhodomonas_salina.5
MSKSSVMFHKDKHINVRVYRLREFVQDGIMELYYVSTHEQAADCLTKSLPSEVLRKHRVLISGTDEINTVEPRVGIIDKGKALFANGGATHGCDREVRVVSQ